jgi:hypothetical protein
MGGVFGTFGGEGTCIESFGGETWRNKPLESIEHIGDNNIKKITCSIYDSTNSWRDNVFSRNDVSKEENDKIK